MSTAAVVLGEHRVDAAPDHLAAEHQREGRLDLDLGPVGERSGLELRDQLLQVGVVVDAEVGPAAQLVGVDEQLLPAAARSAASHPGVEPGAEPGRRRRLARHRPGQLLRRTRPGRRAGRPATSPRGWTGAAPRRAGHAGSVPRRAAAPSRRPSSATTRLPLGLGVEPARSTGAASASCRAISASTSAAASSRRRTSGVSLVDRPRRRAARSPAAGWPRPSRVPAATPAAAGELAAPHELLEAARARSPGTATGRTVSCGCRARGTTTP